MLCSFGTSTEASAPAVLSFVMGAGQCVYHNTCFLVHYLHVCMNVCNVLVRLSIFRDNLHVTQINVRLLSLLCKWAWPVHQKNGGRVSSLDLYLLRESLCNALQHQSDFPSSSPSYSKLSSAVRGVASTHS